MSLSRYARRLLHGYALENVDPIFKHPTLNFHIQKTILQTFLYVPEIKAENLTKK